MQTLDLDPASMKKRPTDDNATFNPTSAPLADSVSVDHDMQDNSESEMMGSTELNDPARPAKINVQINPNAPYTFGHVSMLWERMKLAEDLDHPFYPFHSADKFEIVEFLVMANLYKKRQRTLGVCQPPFISLLWALFNMNEWMYHWIRKDNAH